MTDQVAGAATLRRIGRELVEIQQNPSPDWAAESVLDNLLEWHFTVRGPEGTDFESGLYHGRIVLPINYPFAPPSISLLTPSGRFDVNRKICLSISNFHPELWQPAWGVRTILEALRSFLPTPADGAVGSLEWPADMRKKLASESHNWMCPVCLKSNIEILPSSPVEPILIDTLRSDTTNDQQTHRATHVAGPVAAPTHVVHATKRAYDRTLSVAIIILFGLILALVADIFLHP